MIILREKQYTRADKEAWLEFLRATNNFRTIPKGYTGMDAKDIFRFKNAANIVNRQGINSLDPNEAKYLLGKMGLHKAANNYDHMLKKYVNTDPAVLERFRRIQEAKRKKTLESSQLQTSVNNDKRMKNLDLVINRYENKLSKIQEPRKIIEEYKKQHPLYFIRYNKFKKFEDKVYDNSRKEDKAGKIYKKLINRRKVLKDNLIDEKTTNAKFIKLLKKRNKDSNVIGHSISNELSLSMPREYETLQNNLKNRKVNINESANNESYMIPGTRRIFVHNKEPFNLGHEGGHVLFEQTHPEKENNRKFRQVNLETLASELGASAHSMAQAKNLNLSPEIMKKGRRELEQLGNTYFVDYLRNKATDFGIKFDLAPRLRNY